MTDEMVLTWGQIEIIADTMIKDLLKVRKRPYDAIIAVERGGLFPLAFLARHFKNPIFRQAITHTVRAESYEGREQKELVVSSYLQLPKDILLNTLILDDIADTGKTLTGLLGMYPGAEIACLIAKANCIDLVGYCGLITDPGRWVTFPWETIWREADD